MAMLVPAIAIALAVAQWTCLAAVTNPADVSALRALKRGFQDPLAKLSSWNEGDPCALPWEGIICEQDDMFRVTEIHLMNFNLSGPIASEVGDITSLQILNFMWNRIIGRIPASLGKLSGLRLLLLNGNQLTGEIPAEIGNLVNLNRFQIDENQISGPVPSSFRNLKNVKHLHMNNNSLSGSIPPELGQISGLFHLLLDNNNLTGPVPSELSNISSFQILQLDNNQLSGDIPESFAGLTRLLKLSMRNCNFEGKLVAFGGLQKLEYLDLSSNRLSGELPKDTLPMNVTTINLSNNLLEGEIPVSFARHDTLQALLLQNNKINGTVPADFLQRKSNGMLVLDLQNNSVSALDKAFEAKRDKTVVWLFGNPKVCGETMASKEFCKPHSFEAETATVVDTVQSACDPNTCAPPTEMIPALAAESKCRCAGPIQIRCRLKSPGFTFFDPYAGLFETYMSAGLKLSTYQVHVASYAWEPGPRLRLTLKIYPPAQRKVRSLGSAEVKRIFEAFTGWKIPDNPMFGPRELISFDSPQGEGPFSSTESESGGLSKGGIAGILIAVVAATSIIVAGIVFYMFRRRPYRIRSSFAKSLRSLKMENVRAFTLSEMRKATKNFDTEIGRGGYGKVYKGLLEDDQVVAIKRAEEGSHQGEKEFLTEIELLSRIHHRNLVSLVGFCVDDGEQMLVYEYVGGGTLQDRIAVTAKRTMPFRTRVYVALGAARGILYLHSEANPPIIHRDIKGTNILIGEKNNAKVSDFGLSKLAPENDVPGSLGISTVVKGTPGYLDPEYFLTRKLSDKSDIYSFGVVLLEIVTGRQAIFQGKNLVREVQYTYKADETLSIVDPMIADCSPRQFVDPFVKLALSCCMDNADERPSIRSVVRDLEDLWKAMASSADVAVDHEEEELLFERDENPLDVSLPSSSRIEEFSRTVHVAPR